MQCLLESEILIRVQSRSALHPLLKLDDALVYRSQLGYLHFEDIVLLEKCFVFGDQSVILLHHLRQLIPQLVDLRAVLRQLLIYLPISSLRLLLNHPQLLNQTFNLRLLDPIVSRQLLHLF